MKSPEEELTDRVEYEGIAALDAPTRPAQHLCPRCERSIIDTAVQRICESCEDETR